MPKDFASVGHGVALPLSPPQSPDIRSVGSEPRRPSWPRTRSMSHSSPDMHLTVKQRALRIASQMIRRGIRIWRDMSPLQKMAAIVFAIGSFILSILFLVYNERIFAWLEPRAQAWGEMSGGWAILWFLATITAFPPLLGYSTCVTIAGFVYGFPLGWPIVASANVIGSFLSFVVFRNMLSHWANRLVNADPRFKALTLVLKHDGLKLLVMIRLCPLPYSFSNGAMSTFQSVSPASFALATAIATPKLLIHVFIGSRLRELARSESHKMDFGTKVVNYVSIILGMALGLFTGWWVYTKTQARARQLEAEEQARLDDEVPRSARRSSNTPLQHPDSFMDEDEEDDLEWGGRSPRLDNDDIDFLEEDGRDGEYADEPPPNARKV